ncbi:helix-turn-helix domain-containing protein [bacterium SCSIO 12696]|nr:helix-turn-helix domain-containing protein [bacterium SCSIO 12696]
MSNYQDSYPSEPLLRSGDQVRKSAGELLSLEYFEAEPDSMATQAFSQHHILINLKDEPHRLENWRGGQHRDFTFSKHDIVVTPAGLESGWRWHARSKCIVVTLEPDKLETFTQSELGRLLTDQQLLDLPHFKDEDIANAAVMLLDALQLEGSSSDVMFESLARVFLVKLVNKYGDDRSDDITYSDKFTAKHYKRVLDFVANHFGDSIQIDDLARDIGMSSSHFSRLFKQVIGDTPYQFLMRYRVERAAEMIANTKKPLFDIALSCGFSDQAHLTRTFKQLNNTTPKAWRKQFV